MLERFYDPLAGSISLDGTNIKDINVQYLRGLIGYVGQEPTLFATSIRQNISYGNPEASQEQIEEAAKLANAHDFITSLPDGYDTQVGDKGGQARLIQLAKYAFTLCSRLSPVFRHSFLSYSCRVGKSSASPLVSAVFCDCFS